MEDFPYFAIHLIRKMCSYIFSVIFISECYFVMVDFVVSHNQVRFIFAVNSSHSSTMFWQGTNSIMKYFPHRNQTCAELNDVCTQDAASLSSSGSICCYILFLKFGYSLTCCEISVIFQYHDNFELGLGTKSSIGLNLADYPANDMFEDETRFGSVVPCSGPDGDEIEKASFGFIFSIVRGKYCP